MLQCISSLGFILRQDQTSRGEIEIVKVGFPNDLAEWDGIFIPQSIVDRPSFRKLDLWAVAKHRGQARLWVHIQRQNPVATQCIPLSQMDGRGCLAGTALEVHDRNDL